jgi:hypothetical protein
MDEALGPDDEDDDKERAESKGNFLPKSEHFCSFHGN